MTAVRRLWLLLTRPAEWSALRYREKVAMDYTALHPERWHRNSPPDPEKAPSGDAEPEQH